VLALALGVRLDFHLEKQCLVQMEEQNLVELSESEH